MKQLTQYIQEKLKINSKSNITQNYNYQPKDKNELINLINKLIKERGHNADLNDIDTSNIKDMSYLFASHNYSGDEQDEYIYKFNGDISKWDVSNVTNMAHMFDHSEFDGDISKWDVSNVTNMDVMFYYSKFNGDISEWNINKVKNMVFIFTKCPIEKNPPSWYKE